MEKILDKENLRCAAEMMLEQLSREAHENAVKHGFYDYFQGIQDILYGADCPCHANEAKRNVVLAQLAKVCSEVGEAVACIQHDKTQDVGEELADVVIRVFDLAAFMDIDIGKAVINKMVKNVSRPYMHGKVC